MLFFFISVINFFDCVCRRLGLFCIKIYQFLISPFVVMSCKFSPSCSEYAKEQLRKKNFLSAVLLIIIRIVRCNPLSAIHVSKTKNKN